MFFAVTFIHVLRLRTFSGIVPVRNEADVRTHAQCQNLFRDYSGEKRG